MRVLARGAPSAAFQVGLRPRTVNFPTPNSPPQPPATRRHGEGEASEPKRQSLEDVLEAGMDSLRLSIDLVSGSVLDFNTLDEAVAQTGSVLGAVRNDQEATTATIDMAATQSGVTVEELEAFLKETEQAYPRPSLESLEETSAFENTSILLHQFDLARARKLEDWSRALEICTRGLDPHGVSALILDATRDMSELRSLDEFDGWMGSLVTILRRTVPSLCDQLAEFAVDATPYGREALWPFVVDELLTTLKGRRNGLDPRVHALDPVALESAIGRLCRLPSIARPRVAPGMFALEQTFAHPLLLRLMQSPARHAIGPVILGAFRQSLPTDPGISFCVFAMRHYEESLGWLLSTQLETPHVPVHPDVQRSAAWLLVSVLDSMDGERRDEVWIPGALHWLGERDSMVDAEAQREGTSSLLERIVRERNGLRHTWNRDCRRAAKAALIEGGFA